MILYNSGWSISSTSGTFYSASTGVNLVIGNTTYAVFAGGWLSGSPLKDINIITYNGANKT